MILLCFVLFQTPDIAVFPHYLKHPSAAWVDLDRDGTDDLVLWDQEAGFFRWSDQGFEQIQAGSDMFDLLLLPDANGLKPVLYKNGALWREKEDGADLMVSWLEPDQVRPGKKPIFLNQELWLADRDGYTRVEGDCVKEHLQAEPLVRANRTSLEVLYPIPHPADLDRNSGSDLFSEPLAMKGDGNLHIWRAVRETPTDTWDEGWQSLQFAPNLRVARYQLGWVDDDPYPELLVIALPNQVDSVFEELVFYFYQGTGPGTWNPVPLQQVETKQNLWQTGPIEMDAEGVRLSYYKGLFRTIFRIDHYAWKDGYLSPEPSKVSWKVPDGARFFIENRFDFTGDGIKDMVLADPEGLILYPGNRDSIPYEESRSQRLIGWPDGESTSGISFDFGGNFEVEANAAVIGEKIIPSPGKLAYLPEKQELWTMRRRDDGGLEILKVYPQTP